MFTSVASPISDSSSSVGDGNDMDGDNVLELASPFDYARTRQDWMHASIPLIYASGFEAISGPTRVWAALRTTATSPHHKYCAIWREAEETLADSKQIWPDTPASVYALQAFQPPKDPVGMQSFLQHSVQNYCPLASEFCPRRGSCTGRNAPAPELSQVPSPVELLYLAVMEINAALEVKVNNTNVGVPKTPTVFSAKHEALWGPARPRVASAARRSALGWAKRHPASSKVLKENKMSRKREETSSDTRDGAK
ncbi:hypothetical protein B0H14DRAFT_3864607 [Mycena olivaceomarginata]|nr:hypothetical protein B0H14DRAFT_3864607 [Mycena olivaceomarginata]